MQGLTAKQKAVLEFLKDYTRKYGYPPTVREIGERFKFLWAAASRHLKAIEKKGFIRIYPARSRGIEIMGLMQAKGLNIPVAGRIRAGKPALAAEDIDEHILIDKNIFREKDAFSLRVQGESMIEAGIFDGDYVIVKPQATIENGGIGVVLIGDEATVKRVFIKEDAIMLKPENKDMEPVSYKPGEISIIGRVIGVVRKL
ncbi:MAG: transcriptional repressor LexA [Nitrospirae bacterium]|nr:transcriptional repressor LexA [Nitrospirota bacterium]